MIDTAAGCAPAADAAGTSSREPARRDDLPRPAATSTALTVSDLVVEFPGPAGSVRAVDGIDLQVASGEIVALVGESGCGKSATASAILGLLPPQARISGEVAVGSRLISSLSEGELADVRGAEVGMIFQDPLGSLNPVLPIGRQIAETVRRHRGLSRKSAATVAVEVLGRVGFAEPERWFDAFPHELSGGMCQRVCIGMAICCGPSVVIADEPTTALDTTVQATVLDLLAETVDADGTGMLLITHDLGVVAQMADRVVVMYAGLVVESAPVHQLFARPRHPYTTALLAATPRHGVGGRLTEIPGTVPVLQGPAKLCVFADRCDSGTDECRQAPPSLREIDTEHRVACVHPRSA